MDMGCPVHTPGKELNDPCEDDEVKITERRMGCWPNIGEHESDRLRPTRGSGSCPVAVQYFEKTNLLEELMVLPIVETDESSSVQGVPSVVFSRDGKVLSDWCLANVDFTISSDSAGIPRSSVSSTSLRRRL
jgi:hypothetical protein